MVIAPKTALIRDEVKSAEWRLLRIAAPVLAVYFAIFSVFHFSLIEPPANRIMMTVALATAVLLGGFVVMAKRWPEGVSHAHFFSSIVATLVLLNSAVHVFVTGQLIELSNLALTIIGLGFLLLSGPVYVVLMILTGAIVVLALSLFDDPDKMHFSFMLVSSAVLSVIAFLARVRWYTEQIKLVQFSEAQRVELSALHEESVEQKDVAEKMAKEKMNFVATLSHEIRTPLNAIVGLTTILSQRQLSDDAEEMVMQVKGAGEHLSELVNSILDISKLDSGTVELEERDFSVRDQIDLVSQFLAPRANDKSISFIQSVEPSVPAYVAGDKTRLSQILINLISNAIKFTQSGEVSLTVSSVAAREGESRLTFEIADTGIGIPADKIDRIFNEFEQAQDSYAGGAEGVGLGLAVSRRLADLMEGTIQVESKVGEGSCFRVELPFQTVIGRADGPVPKNTTEERKGGLNILVADDNLINKFILETALHGMGHETTTVENGQCALDLLEAMSFDLVLMDIEMPVLDGLSAMTAIRDNPDRYGFAPVFAVTANAMVGERSRMLAAGFADYIAKPVDLDVLAACLSQLSALAPERDDGKRAVGGGLT